MRPILFFNLRIGIRKQIIQHLLGEGGAVEGGKSTWEASGSSRSCDLPLIKLIDLKFGMDPVQ